MRPIERIDNFLEKVDWSELLKKFVKIKDPKIYIKLGMLPKITKYWKENPDQRIGQVLINLGIIPNGDAWDYEEWEILKDQGFPPEEYLFWTSHYDEHEKELDKPITRLVANLTPEHILRIKEYFFRKHISLPEIYIKAFDNVLAKHALKEAA